MHTELVAGRACGTCEVCCVALSIDDPDLQKLPGIACPNLAAGAGCRIYETRPRTCMTFFCGWRRLRWIAESLRPDRSGVLVRMTEEAIAEPPARRAVIEFVLLTPAALDASGLPEAVAAAVQGGLASYLVIPGPAGFSATRLPLNERLADAVRRRDKAGVLRHLRALRVRGHAAAHRPVVLSGGAPLPAP